LFLLLSGFSWSVAECVLGSVQVEGIVPEYLAPSYQNLNGKTCEDADKLNERALEWFWNHGFPGAKITMKTEPGGTRILSERGEAFVWAAAENAVQGKTKHHVFAKLSGLTEGEAVSLRDFKLSERKLLRSAYYQEKSPAQLYRDAERNRLIPVFFLEDRKANQLEGYFSYASGESGGINGKLLVDLYNIAGTARDLSVSGETGEWERRLSLNYKEPWIFGSEWNALLRGYLEDDKEYRDARIELGLSRSIGFDFDFSVLGGLGDDEWTSTLEFAYQNEDRYLLPTTGSRVRGSMQLMKKYADSANVKVFLEGNVSHLIPIYGNFTLQFLGSAGTVLPTNEKLSLDELYSLGGIELLKGYRSGFFRTRAYGVTEMNLSWRALSHTAIQAFFQPALHRARAPEHGWIDTYSYGIGLAQYRQSWSASLYYALNADSDILGGLLHFGVRTLF
jgi:outer membrane protein assembly factor BamA